MAQISDATISMLGAPDLPPQCRECDYAAYCDFTPAEAAGCQYANIDPDLEYAAMPDADAYREWQHAVYGF